MRGLQRYTVLIAIGNMVIYVPIFLFLMMRAESSGIEPKIVTLLPWHFAGMLLNLLAIFATIQDLYLRDFPHPNSKLTWCLLIVFTGGIGWIVYIFKHALKPRPE